MAKKKKNYELAEIDYMAGMKYKDIAKKYGVSINTVKSWKQRYKWKRDNTHTKNKNSMHTKESAKEEVKTLMENEELTDKQKLFCIYYTKYFNATKAYKKAYKCSYNTAMVEGSRHLRNPKIKEEIDRLKASKLKGILLEEEDLLQKYIDIAFADISDYVEFGRKEKIIGISDEGDLVKAEDNFIDLKDSDDVDGTLITEVKTSRQGVSVKLEDRMKALEWLSKFFEMNPEHKYKKEFDNKKLQLEKERFEHQREMDERKMW